MCSVTGPGRVWPANPDDDPDADFIRLDMQPQDAVPNPATQGALYYDNGTNTVNGDPKLRAYNGAAWSDFRMTSDASMTTEDLVIGAAITLTELAAAPTGADGKIYNDDGTNRLDQIAEPTLRYYNGSSYLDMPGASSGADDGATSLVLTPASGSYTIAADTGYTWYQVGALLVMKAYLHWTASSSPSGNLTVPSFLPANAMTSTYPSQFGVSIESYTGIAFGNNNTQVAARIAPGSRTLVFLKVDPNTGPGMTQLTAGDVSSAGIVYLTATMIVSQRA